MKKHLFRNKRVRTVILTIISAIIIVLSWFILNYLFEQYGDIFYQYEESDIVKRSRPWEWILSLLFFAIYFGLEIINYKFSELEYGVYVVLQGFLDLVIFISAIEYLGSFVCFIPTNTAENPYIEFKALINYAQEYVLAFFLSNIIMLVISSIDNYKKGIK